MGTWSQILIDVKNCGNPDVVRRRHLVGMHQLSSRNTILYATKFTQNVEGVPPSLLSIVDEDMQGLMEVIHNLPSTELDLVLHSPGGSLEATESIVEYLRSKFSHIRVIVPHLAQSAATMIACAANSIMMGKHSFLGPIDPQLMIRTPQGQIMVPAQAITEQFKRATEECSDPRKLAAWAPMLGQYGPHLLAVCENASAMSRELVQKWLAEYMLKNEPDKRQAADRIAAWLSDHMHFKSHARHIPRTELIERGLVVKELESDQRFQDAVLSLFHATTISFDQTSAVKIIENHTGKAFIKMHIEQQIMIPVQATPPANMQRPPSGTPPRGKRRR